MNRRSSHSAWNTSANFGVWSLQDNAASWRSGKGRGESGAEQGAAFRRDSIYQALLSEKLSRFQQAIRNAFELV